MSNLSLTYVVLGAYVSMGDARYCYFLLAALLYGAVLFLNVSLMAAIAASRSLREPMYLFLLSLFANELYGSAGLFPPLLVQVLADSHAVAAPLCFLQIFVIYSYANVEFCTLAVMSYDRYLAICRPLRYHRLMTPGKALVLVLVLWGYCFLKVLVNVSLNLRLRFCGDVIDSLYCHNYRVALLACGGNRVNDVYGLCGTVLGVLVPLAPIVYSYARILQVCAGGSRRTRRKAAATCCPHLVSLLNFSFGCSFEVLQSRFDMRRVPAALRAVLSLYFLVIQPLLTPVVYGMRVSRVRRAYRDTLRCKTTLEPDL